MSLRNKVEAMERRIGKSDDPLVVHLITYFENENGEPDTKVRKSVVVYENGQSEFLEPEEHETDAEFRERVRNVSQSGHN